MKLKKLHINSFRHLESLKFDFTYPEDFYIVEKRGKPLDKICIIGQSATGKTGLLELLYKQLSTLSNTAVGSNTFMTENTDFNDCEIEFYLHDQSVKTSKNKLQIGERIYENAKESMIGGVFDFSFVSKYKTYYFKSNLISEKNVSILDLNPLELREIFSTFKKEPLKSIDTIVFSEEIDNQIWYHLLNEIIEFHSKRYQKFTDLIGKGLIANLEKFNNEVKQFLEKTPNPVEKFGKKFNLLLEKLHLEIDYDNTEFAIPIRNKRKSEIISIQNISTGTKGLLLSFLPLYQLNTKNAIILVDEPERSLYPDIQMELVNFYQKLAPEAQLVIATHSPFVAASFEPCERFILYFDEDGKVAVRRGISPVGDDPNDIIYEDFGVNYYNKDYQEKFKHYLELLDKSKNEENKELKKKLILEASKLGNIYNFNLNEEDRKTQ